jgi:hypothetical protein
MVAWPKSLCASSACRPLLGKQHEYYETWYYAEDGGRISCGTFQARPESQTSVSLTAPSGARDYPEIEITCDPTTWTQAPAAKRFSRGTPKHLSLQL